MKSMKKNTIAMLLMRILNIAFPLLTGPYIARVLNKTDYGYYNSVVTIVSFFLPIATLGAYNYGIRAISQVKDDIEKVNKVFSKLFYIVALSSIATYCVYMGWVQLTIHDPLQYKIYFIYGFQIIAQMLYIEWVNEAFEDYTFIFYKTLFIRIAMLVGVFTFVKNENDVIAFTWVSTIVSILNYVISYVWIKSKLKFTKVSLDDIVKIIPSLFALLILANANMLYTFLDRLFISMRDIPEHITYYTISYNIVILIVLVISGSIAVVVPRLGYYLGKNQKEEYKDLVYKTAKMFHFFIAPVSLGLFVLGGKVTLIYAGEKYIEAGLYTMLFALRSIVWSIDVILGTHVIFVNGYERKLSLYVLIGGLVNLTLNCLMLFTNINDLKYIILKTIIAEIIVVMLYCIFIKKHKFVSLRIIFKNLLKYVLITCGFIPLTLFIEFLIPTTMIINYQLIINIIATIISCTMYYIMVLWLVKDNVFINLLHELFRFNPFRKKVN